MRSKYVLIGLLLLLFALALAACSSQAPAQYSMTPWTAQDATNLRGNSLICCGNSGIRKTALSCLTTMWHASPGRADISGPAPNQDELVTDDDRAESDSSHGDLGLRGAHPRVRWPAFASRSLSRWQAT